MIRAPLARALVVLGAALAVRVAGATTAADLCSSTANPCIVSRAIAVGTGSDIDLGSRALEVRQGGVLDVGTGTMTIRAGSVRLAPGGALVGRGSTGGSITVVTTGPLSVEASGSTRARIDVTGDSIAGHIDLAAGGAVSVSGTLVAKANTTTGRGGTIRVQGATVGTTGELTVAGGGQGLGGDVDVVSSAAMALGGAVDASGGNVLGGGTITLTSGAGVSTTGRLDVSARNGSADGGSITITAAGAVNLQGPILGQGLCSDTLGCASSGADVSVDADLGVTIAGSLTVSGGGPDGTGGDVSITAGTDAVITGTLAADGKGVEGQGADVDVIVGGNVRLGLVDVSGGSDGGGSLLVEAGGTVTVPATADVSADSRTAGTAGSVTLSGEFVDVAGKVHASAGDAAASGGLVWLDGCEVDVVAGAQLTTRGTTGVNRVTASGQMTLGGTFVSGVGATGAGGRNELRFRDASTPPVVLGTATFVPARVTAQDGTLAPCEVQVPPGCGNGVLEDGETCDDSNVTACDGCSADCRVEECGDGVTECGEQCDDDGTTACDGCSATCRIETCGNAVVECAEECDEGEANGTPGGACRADCTLAPPPGCGDGTPSGEEQCDDGNTVSCDGCSATCRSEGCGNGTVECGEQCDDLNVEPCDGCSATCRLEACGNGVRECQEECDEGARNGTAGSSCDTLCRLGTLCTESGTSPCIPCARDTDCDPLGRCGGQTCGVDGVCRGVAPPSCDDGAAGTSDRCVLDATGAPVCQHECLGTGACDDGNACNGIESCADGACAAGPAPVCDDGNPCTDDGCDPAAGCVSTGRQGVAGIGCRLAPAFAALDGAGPLEITAPLQEKLRGRLARVDTRLQAAGQAEAAEVPQLERAHLRAAETQLKALGRIVARSVRRGRLAARIGEPVAAASAATREAISTVRALLPP